MCGCGRSAKHFVEQRLAIQTEVFPDVGQNGCAHPPAAGLRPRPDRADAGRECHRRARRGGCFPQRRARRPTVDGGHGRTPGRSRLRSGIEPTDTHDDAIRRSWRRMLSTAPGFRRRTTAITQRKRRRERNHHSRAQPPFPLGVSRPGSLGFRIRFVFPVVHPFPLVVSQYLIRVQLTPGPSQNRACAVNAPGSPPAPAGLTPVAWTPEIAPSPALCPEGVSVATRTGLDAFPAPALPGFDPLDWASSFNGTMHPSDSLLSFASLACEACRAYSDGHDWAS